MAEWLTNKPYLRVRSQVELYRKSIFPRLMSQVLAAPYNRCLGVWSEAAYAQWELSHHYTLGLRKPTIRSLFSDRTIVKAAEHAEAKVNDEFARQSWQDAFSSVRDRVKVQYDTASDYYEAWLTIREARLLGDPYPLDPALNLSESRAQLLWKDAHDKIWA